MTEITVLILAITVLISGWNMRRLNNRIEAVERELDKKLQEWK